MTLEDLTGFTITGTAAVVNALSGETLGDYLSRFFSGDFGKMPPEDVKSNLDELKAGAGRCIGRYGSGMGKDVYIIADLAAELITILFCEEY